VHFGDTLIKKAVCIILMQRLGFAPFRKKQNVLHFSRMTPISFELTLLSILLAYKLDQNKHLRTGYMIYIYQYILHIIGSNIIYQYPTIKIHHIGIIYMTIIMLASSYGTTIYEEQERYRSRYCHKPIVQRCTTPSSSW
jgi:hypothetical protein